MNQTRYGVYHGYLEFKTKRVFAIAFLGKKLAFHTEICDFFQYLILKYFNFNRVNELFKSNQTRHGVSYVNLDFETKRFFCYCLRWKKVSFWYGSLWLFLISSFKKRSFSSGQGVVQIEPNLVWSIPWTLECNTNKFCHRLSWKTTETKNKGKTTDKNKS